ncbi:MAG: glucose-6-phosphate dehydrogenase [Thermoguttaceae bacterium]
MNSIIIFGASGDLTSRKLIPALFNLYVKKRLPEPFCIIGFSRTQMNDATWRSELATTTQQFSENSFARTAWNEFAQKIHYFPGDIEKTESFAALKKYLNHLESGGNNDVESFLANNENMATGPMVDESSAMSATTSNRLYYLSTAPKFYGVVAEKLAKEGMTEQRPHQERRIVIEKPFGTDLTSAIDLSAEFHRHFDESQIFRIDHYLGKETVNNVLVLRFANTIFEPIWNRNYIDNIQITANEDVLVGRRAPFYETAGVLRDMFQNHLLQIMTFVTMEPPTRFDAKSIRDEKVKVLQAIRYKNREEAARNSVRGQYVDYRKEPGVAPTSRTATFGAVRLLLDNWRWKDVPIFLRSGKGMSCRSTQIVIQFRMPPHCLFQDSNLPNGELHGCSQLHENRLLIQIQPAEGIQLHLMSKVPDSERLLRSTELGFNFKSQFNEDMPDSYQRLLLDALRGDASLFARSDEVESAWQIIDPIQKAWDESSIPDSYPIGSFGPACSDSWIESFGASWFNLCPLV